MQVRLPQGYECWAREAFREGDDTIPSHVMGFAYWVLDGRTDAIAGGATPDEAVAMAATIVGADRCDTLVDVVEGPGLEELTSEYEAYLEETGLPKESADDVLLTCRAAIPYLSSYIMRWEAAETREHAAEAAKLEAERAAKLAEARAMAVCDEVEAEVRAKWQAEGKGVWGRELLVEARRAEAAEAFDPLMRWAETRVWCADFVAAGLPYVEDAFCEEDTPTVSGYAYHDGSWIQDLGDGQYWAPLGQWDVMGTLAEVEAELWEHHAQFNTD